MTFHRVCATTHCLPLTGLLSCNPHSLLELSHHQRPARTSSPGRIARVHGAQPMLGNPFLCSVFTGILCSAMKSSTCFSDQVSSGLYLINLYCSSHSTRCMVCRLADCSARTPVIQTFVFFKARFKGSTFRMWQHSFRFSTDS